MKSNFIKSVTIFLFNYFLFSQTKIDITSLEKSGDLFVVTKTQTLFTGIAFGISKETKNKIQETTFLRGKLHGVYTSWWENGSKKQLGRYKQGIKDSRWVDYYVNGNIASERNYKNGINNGFHINWHDNGVKKSKGLFKKGKKVGSWTYWDNKGNILNYACINTDFGQIVVRLFSDTAPLHTKSFIGHINSGYYNSTIFHRVIPGFIIQGGDPNTKSTNRKIHGIGGFSSEYYGIGEHKDQSTWRIPAEYNFRSHKRGMVSMARGYEENSAGSQFFINVKDNPELDNRYTVFGEVIDGMEVIDEITKVPVDNRDNPFNRIQIEITICG